MCEREKNEIERQTDRQKTDREAEREIEIQRDREEYSL